MNNTYSKGDKVVLNGGVPDLNLFKGDTATVLEVFRHACAVHFDKWTTGILPHRTARDREYRYNKPAHAISKKRLRHRCIFGP